MTGAPAPADTAAGSPRPGVRPELLILLLALVARVCWAWVVPFQVCVGDSVAYDRFAKMLATFGVYGWKPSEPSAYWPVGTSFVYSLLYRVAGIGGVHRAGYWPFAALNIALGLLIVHLGMRLARRWFDPRAARVCGVLLALWPTQIEFTTLMASELLFTAALLLAIEAWPGSWRPGRLVLTGLAFAGAVYVRPTALLVPAVLAAVDAARGRRLGAPAASLGITMAVMGLAIAPWMARNERVFGKPVMISCNGGSNLWMGNHPGTTGDYQELPHRPPELNEVQFDRELRDKAVAYIKAHPGAFVVRSALKALRFHDRETSGVRWNFDESRGGTVSLLKWLGQTYWLGVLAAGLIGVALLIRREGLVGACCHPAVAVWGYFTAVHAVIVIQDRYHFPITPMIGALAATVVGPLVTREPKGGA